MFEEEQQPEDIFASTDSGSVGAGSPPQNLPGQKTKQAGSSSSVPARPSTPATQSPTPPAPVVPKTTAPPTATPPNLPTGANKPVEAKVVAGRRFGALKAILVIIIVIIVLSVAGTLTYFLLTRQTANQSEPLNQIDNTVNDLGTETAPADQNSQDQPSTAPVSAPVVIPTPEASLDSIDSDGDGLSDAQEIEIGTDINNPDTDADGLGDSEEVEVYGTNPLDEDTDGDTFLDGAEVSNGYNPNGSGRLFQVPPIK